MNRYARVAEFTVLPGKVVGIIEFGGRVLVATDAGVFVKGEDDIFRPMPFVTKEQLVEKKIEGAYTECARAVDSLRRTISAGHDDTTDIENRVLDMAVKAIKHAAKRRGGATALTDSLPPSTEPAIKGRVPTKWLVDHMHEFTHEEFYDETLSEDDLRAILEKRTTAPPPPPAD